MTPAYNTSPPPTHPPPPPHCPVNMHRQAVPILLEYILVDFNCHTPKLLFLNFLDAIISPKPNIVSQKFINITYINQDFSVLSISDILTAGLSCQRTADTLEAEHSLNHLSLNSKNYFCYRSLTNPRPCLQLEPTYL